MKLFLDTANVNDIEQRLSTGLISGITTNPSLILKSGVDPQTTYRYIQKLGIDYISMEVVADNFTDFIHYGLNLFDNYGSSATVKLPCTMDGIKACKYLTNIGVKVNMTLVFSVSQAILCALAGSTYVSPFVGRMDDNSLSGLDLIGDIASIYKLKGVKTKVLAASIRDVKSVGQAFTRGADICTIPVKVFDDMANHVLTEKGLAIFTKDFEKSLEKIA